VLDLRGERNRACRGTRRLFPERGGGDTFHRPRRKTTAGDEEDFGEKKAGGRGTKPLWKKRKEYPGKRRREKTRAPRKRAG